MSNKSDNQQFSFLSLLLQDDEPAEGTELFASDELQEFNCKNSGPVVAGQSQVLHAPHQEAPAQFFGVNSVPVAGQSQVLHAPHQEARAQFVGVNSVPVVNSVLVAGHSVQNFGLLNSQVISEEPRTLDCSTTEKRYLEKVFGETDKGKQISSEERERWIEESKKNRCHTFLDSCEPFSLGFKMVEASRRKCKNVISDIENKIKEEGNTIAPILADIWNKNDNSTNKNSFTGICTLNFKDISKHLDKNGYETLDDFVKAVQLMLKGVADDFGFSFEVVSEVQIIHALFFEVIEGTFREIDFCKAKSDMKFSILRFRNPLRVKTRARNGAVNP